MSSSTEFFMFDTQPALYQFWYLTKCFSPASRVTQFDIKYQFEEQKLIDTTYYTSGESHGYKVTAEKKNMEGI